jgi:hydrogenase assembly chaperone HypC/HupF
MCLAIPGKVVSVKGNNVTVEYGSERRQASAMIDVSEGEYVLVTGNMVIQKVPEKEALESLKAWEKLLGE